MEMPGRDHNTKWQTVQGYMGKMEKNILWGENVFLLINCYQNQMHIEAHYKTTLLASSIYIDGGWLYIFNPLNNLKYMSIFIYTNIASICGRHHTRRRAFHSVLQMVEAKINLKRQEVWRNINFV